MRAASNYDVLLHIRESRDSEVRLFEAPRNDGAQEMHHPRHTSTFPRRLSPEFCITMTLIENRGRREDRMAAAPGAPAQKEFARAREPQVQTVATGLPCAVVYGLYALSSVNHPVCHRHQRDAPASSRTWRRGLGAPGPHDFAVRESCRSSVGNLTSTAAPPHVS